MKRLLSLFTALTFFLSTLSPAFALDKKLLPLLLAGDYQILETNGPLAYYNKPFSIVTTGGLSFLPSKYPSNANSTVQQVKGSGFSGVGTATVAGLLTTDTITASGTVPTCAVNGTLIFGTSTNSWDIYVKRAGVVWAYWPGINIGKSFELDASGNGHDLTALTTTAITERVDGTGTDYCNIYGFSSRENRLLWSDDISVSSSWHLVSSGSVSVGNVLNFAANNSSGVYINNSQALTSGQVVRYTLKVYGTQDQMYRLYVDETAPPYNEAISSFSILSGDMDIITIEKTMSVNNTPYVKIGNGYLGLSGSLHLSNITSSIVSSDNKPLVSFGDSIGASSVQADDNRGSRSYTSVYGNYRNAIKINNSVSGYVLSQIRTAMNTKMLSGCGLLFLEGGVNDIGQAVSDPNAAMQSTMISMITKGLTYTNNIVVFTVGFGQGFSADMDAWATTYNTWLKSYSATHNLIVVDLRSLLSDVNGNQDPQYFTHDNTHPNDLGHQKIANWLISNVPYNGDVYQPITTTTTQIYGRQPAGYQLFTVYLGPLRRDLQVISGSVYPNLTVKSPLGPTFQVINTWTGGATVDLSSFTDTDKTRFGSMAGVIYSIDRTTNQKLQIDRVIGN